LPIHAGSATLRAEGRQSPVPARRASSGPAPPPAFFAGVNGDVVVIPVMNADDLQKGLGKPG